MKYSRKSYRRKRTYRRRKALRRRGKGKKFAAKMLGGGR